MMTLFDKQVQLRMGQANVKSWIDDLLPLVTDQCRSPGRFGLRHASRLPLADAPEAYAMFLDKGDGAVKVVSEP